MNKRLTRISKYLTFILRHEPGAIGMQLDAEGYLVIEDLVQNATATGKSISVEQVQQVVDASEQNLFTLSEDGSRIKMTDSKPS